jgi:hypothetical protein
MVSTIERRVSRLETSFGGGDSCERCEGTVIIVGVSGEISVTKGGSRLTSEAARVFHREEEPHGICPACGGYRERVRIVWGPGSGGAAHHS